ncbi:tetratricopeptide repeat protein [Larkinella harenae]
MEKDLTFWVKHETIQSGLLENPQNCLAEITDYLFMVSGVDESLDEWQQLRTFFATKLPTCFDLAFKEALQDDDKGFRSFQIWMLEEIQEQNWELQKGQAKILAELKKIKAGKIGLSTTVLQAFAEETAELKRILRENHTEVVGYLECIIKMLEKPTSTYPRELNNFSAFSGEFVGRDAELNDLVQKLQTSQRVVLMNGLGGIGKTTLARKYMQQHKLNYQHVLWVELVVSDAKAQTQTADDLLNAFVIDAVLLKNLRLELPQPVDVKAFFGLIMNTLRNMNGPNLLIIDNASTELADRAIRDLLPGPPNWQVLVTSRQKLKGFELLRLDKLETKAARLLFRKLYTFAVTDEELDELLSTIDYHTLTLELAAKTLENHYGLVSLAELTEKYKSKQLNDPDLQARIETEHSREETELFIHLMQTFNLSGLSEAEQWVMKQFAVLPPEAYPQQQLLEWLQLTDKKDQRKFAENLQSLEKKGWLQQTDHAFSIHRLIQQVVHYQLRPGFEDVKELIESFTDFLRSDTNTDYVKLFFFLPFADFLLDNLPEKDVCRPEVSSLQNNAGVIFELGGNFHKSKKLLETALASDLINFSEDEPIIAVRRSNLASTFYSIGDYGQARDLWETALKSDIASFGENDAIVALRRSNLSNVYIELGEYEIAKELLESALDSDINNFGEEDTRVAVRRSNLGNVYRKLRKYETAKKLLELSLESGLKNLSKGHPALATRLSGLALVYSDLKDYDYAIKLLEEALAFDINNFGESHPYVATRYNNLGSVWSRIEKWTEAKKNFEKAVEIGKKIWGIEHSNVRKTMESLEYVNRQLNQ